MLRVARFAARFGFAVAPETEALMREIVASGELATLRRRARVAGDRARPHGAASVAHDRGAARVRRACARCLPEVDALFGVPQPPAHHPEIDTGVHVCAGARLGGGARRAAAGALRRARARPRQGHVARGRLPRHIAHEQRSVRLARAMSQRLRVPQECRDIAELTARHHGVIHRAAELRPATILDLVDGDGCAAPSRAARHGARRVRGGRVLAARRVAGLSRRRDPARARVDAIKGGERRRDRAVGVGCEERGSRATMRSPPRCAPHGSRRCGDGNGRAPRSGTRRPSSRWPRRASATEPEAAARSRRLPAPSRRAALRPRASCRRSRGSSRRPPAVGRGAW